MGSNKKGSDNASKKFPKHEFVLSHNEYDGYDYIGEINEITQSKETTERAISYITKFTEKYASDMRFINSNCTINSLFEIDGYVFIVEAYSKKDSRYFIEKNVTVIDTTKKNNNNLPIKEYIESDCYLESYYDEKVLKYFRLSTLLIAFSVRSKMFILIKNDNDLSKSVFNTIYKYIPNAITRQISCTETFCDFVDIDSRVYICRCLNDSDYDIFKNYIDNQKNYDKNIAVVDFYSKSAAIDINFENPTISSQCIKIICQKKVNVNELFNETFKKYAKLPKSNLQGYYDAIAFLALYKSYPSEIKKLNGCKEDIEGIYKCLTKGAE